MRPGLATLVLAVVLPPAAQAHHLPTWHSAGSLVAVSVEVDGAAVPLYAARDGSGRFYLEARKGAAYSIRVTNRSHERVGVVVTVDGLNVISGTREHVPSPGTWTTPGRMYVLNPWEETLIRGWRTSLQEVRRFTFVDEERSYASRSGKANSQMGWIQVAVHRERHPRPLPVEPMVTPRDGEDRAGAAEKGRDEARAPSARAEGYPGTGWGRRTEDQAVVVDFHPQPSAAEKVILRYEYASGLRALGILPWPWRGDRLRQRDGGDGFAPPPLWE